MNNETLKKVDSMKSNNETMLCGCCFGNLSDENHEYDKQSDTWFCSEMSEE